MQWPREVPLDGEPADVRDRFDAYDRWLADTREAPKLLLTFEPGTRVFPAVVAWARAHVVGLEVENAGPAGHQDPEDQPDAIGKAIAGWLARHQLAGAREVGR